MSWAALAGAVVAAVAMPRSLLAAVAAVALGHNLRVVEATVIWDLPADCSPGCSDSASVYYADGSRAAVHMLQQAVVDCQEMAVAAVDAGLAVVEACAAADAEAVFEAD